MTKFKIKGENVTDEFVNNELMDELIMRRMDLFAGHHKKATKQDEAFNVKIIWNGKSTNLVAYCPVCDLMNICPITGGFLIKLKKLNIIEAENK